MIAKPMTVVSFRHSVEWFYGRFAPGRSLALLVSDYRVMIAGHVAVAEADVRLRSDRKPGEHGSR